MNTLKKNNKFFHRSQHLPLACSGLALGISGYASLLDVMLQKYFNMESGNIWIASSILIPIAFLLISLLAFKYIKHRKIIKYEMKDPLFSSFIPTYAMVLMCISGYIAGWEKGNGWIAVNQIIAAIIMCTALLMQIILLIFFIKDVLLHHSWNLNPVYGSWFVPSVGMATATTFANRFNQAILPNEFFQAVWYFTFAWYIILLIPITYSMLFKTKVSNDKIASTAVYFAPANLTLSGFLQTFSLNTRAIEIYSNNFIYGMSIVLWAFGFSMMMILIIFSIKILFKTKFSFLFASLTFPLSIGAAGTEYMTVFLNGVQNDQFAKIFADVTGILSIIFSIIVTLVMLYIVPIFFYKIGQILFTKKYDNECHCVYQEQKLEHKENEIKS